MRILVPVDGSQHSRRALQFIREASELTGTRPEVELLSVQSFVSDGMARMFGAEAVKKAYTDEGLKVFEGMGEEIAALGEGIRKEVGFGDPGAAVKQAAEEFGADLIVMGSRGLNPVQGFFMGSFTNTVLSQTKRPVLILRDTTPAPSAKKLRVGVALDGSKYGRAAVDFVIQHPEFFGDAVYEIINVTPDYAFLADTSPDVSDTIGHESFSKAYEDVQKSVFSETVREAMERFETAGKSVKGVHLEGDPSRVIGRYAKYNLDMLVMGSHGRGNFTAAVLGSVAMHVAAGTDIPILIIPR